MTERFAYHPDVQDAWETYLDARDHAEKTRDFGDGCTAARLWRRFINSYEGKVEPKDDRNIAILAAHAKPYFSKLIKIQGVLRSRLRNPGGEFLQSLEMIHVNNRIDLMTIQTIAESADCWDGFCDEIQSVMDRQVGGGQ